MKEFQFVGDITRSDLDFPEIDPSPRMRLVDPDQAKIAIVLFLHTIRHSFEADLDEISSEIDAPDLQTRRLLEELVGARTPLVARSFRTISWTDSPTGMRISRAKAFYRVSPAGIDHARKLLGECS